MSIEKIVGRKAFLGLKKIGLSTAKDIFVSLKTIGDIPTGNKIMSVAGIGPKKTAEIYTFIGITARKRDIDRIYSKVPDRTRFKRLKASLNKVVEDPRKTINNLENVRQQTIAWQNLLAATYNIGRPSSERKKINTYAPVSSSLNPFEINTRDHPKDMIFGEIFITPTNDGGRIAYTVRDLRNDEALLNEVEYFHKGPSVEMATEITNIIKVIYKRFTERTLVGKMFVVSDDSFSSLYSGLYDAFNSEILSGNFFLIRNPEEYFSWEALLKYVDSVTFNEMVERVDHFHAYLIYQRYVSTGGKLDFATWKSDSEEYSKLTFWNSIRELPEYQQASYESLVINDSEHKFYFGVIKGVKGYYYYLRDFVKLDINLPVFRDLGFDGFLDLKKELSVNIDSVLVPPYVIAWVQAAFLGLKVYVNRGKTAVIFRSSELPEIGFVYEVKR